MNLVELDSSKIDLLKLNQAYFYDRLYFVLKEDGNDINYGEYSSRIMKNGAVKVLKSLGIYIVKGARFNKKTYIHEKLQLIIKTTIASDKVISETIIDLANGKYSNIEPIKINDLHIFYLLDDNYPCSMDNSKCTYIVYNPENKLYKIGRSLNVFDRLNSLRNEISPKLELIFYIDNDIEGFLHKKYSKVRIFGEWFKLSIDDILDIKNKYNGKIIQLYP